MKLLPILNAEILEIEPKLTKIKSNGREIVHSGSFSVKMKKPKRGFFESNGEEVEFAILYGYLGMEFCPFGDVRLIEAKRDWIVIDQASYRYIHSGRYEVQK